MVSLVYDPYEHSPMNTAVFLSGSGTNFEALYNEQRRLKDLASMEFKKLIESQ